MSTCSACGTADQPESARFCFACASPLTADPTCASCGGELPPAARFCPNCATAVPGAAPAPAVEVAAPRGSARKITSVLFGDLVGFTTLSESRDPEEVRELLSEYFDECRAVVSRYGGELEKFIGDAVMAVWGLPVTREDDAERAVRAGLELIERVTALGDRIGMHGLALRVGITTAEVAVNLGATGQGMVAGDPVNTAARIQSTASPGEVWVDDTTRAFTASTIAYEDAGSHAMKGKAEPVPLWAARSVIAGARGDRRDDGLEAQLVGRDRELRLVKEVFHRVEETLRPGMLVIDGEPGVGKSRLSWEFEKYVDGFEASVLWHRGRCLSYGEGVAYYALAEAVRGRLAVLADAGGESELDNRSLLQRALVASVPEHQERDWLEPRLAALLGIDSGSSFPREDLFVAWTAFFKYVGLWQTDVSQPQPVVLVIDDAQYADDGLLAFLEHLLAAADYPVFVVVLARPELLADQPALIGNRRVTVVHLEPLSTPDMTRLLDGLVAGVPESVKDELIARSEGIPLYAIETVRSLVDQDLVVAQGGRYVLADPDTVDLTALRAPASLQALIGARLDTLPAEERVVLDRASVLGLVFTGQGIRALCTDVADLDQALSGLIRREVLRKDNDRLSADFGSYRFVQGAVRQVAYGMLSRRDRKATHLTVARALEVELETRTDAYELAPIIAQHYLDAIDAVPGDDDVTELTRASSDHLVLAADRAAALGAPKEAAGHLAKALSRCAPEIKVTIQARLARQLLRAGDHAGTKEHAAAAIKEYDAIGDVVSVAGPVEDLARALVYGDGDLTRSRELVTEYLARLPESDETLTARAALVTALAVVAVRAGNTTELREIADQSLHLAELIGDPAQIADSWISYAISLQSSGLPQLCLQMLKNAVELASEHRTLRERAIALVNLAGFMASEDVPAAIEHGRHGVAAGRELGEDYMRVFAQNNLAVALLHAGDWSETLALTTDEDLAAYPDLDVDARFIRRMIAAARGDEGAAETDEVHEDLDLTENEGLQASYSLDRALRAQATGDPEASQLAVESVSGIGGKMEAADIFWFNWVFASDITAEQGDAASMAEMLTLLEHQRPPYPAAVRAQRSRLQAIVGPDGSAEGLFVEALQTVQAWGSAVFEAHIRADFGAWLTRHGRTEEAADQFGQARAFYERVGARPWLTRLELRSTAG